MNWLQVLIEILKGVPVAAQSPLGLAAFALALVGVITYTLSVLKVTQIERKAALIPEGQRFEYLSRELGRTPYLAQGMTAMQFIAAERIRRIYNIVILIMAFLFVLVLLAVYAVFAEGKLEGRIGSISNPGCLIISCAYAQAADFALERQVARNQSEGPDGKFLVQVALKYIEHAHSGEPLPFLNPADIISEIDPLLSSATFKLPVQHNNKTRSLAQISGAKITLQKFTADERPVIVFDENSWFVKDQRMVLYNVGWGEVKDPQLEVKLFDKKVCKKTYTSSAAGFASYAKVDGAFSKSTPLSTSTTKFNSFKNWQEVAVPKPDRKNEYCADIVLRYMFQGNEVSTRFLGKLQKPEGFGDAEISDRTYRGVLPTQIGNRHSSARREK